MPKNITFNREQILENLIPLFLEKGYNGTSMQDIVDVSQLNRSSLYNTFGDKQALYTAVLSFYSEGQKRMKEKILSLDPNTRNALKKFFEMLFLNQQKADKTEGCLLTNCSLELGKSDPDVRKVLLNSTALMIDNFREIIRLGQQQGEIDRNIDAKESAVFLYNNLQGLRVINGSNPEKAISSQVIDTLFKTL